MARLPRTPTSRTGMLRGARRAWPVVLMAWERWQALPEADKERYRRQAREYVARGRRVIEARSSGRGPRRPR